MHIVYTDEKLKVNGIGALYYERVYACEDILKQWLNIRRGSYNLAAPPPVHLTPLLLVMVYNKMLLNIGQLHDTKEIIKRL